MCNSLWAMLTTAGGEKGYGMTDEQERIPVEQLPIAPTRIREAVALELASVDDLVQSLTLEQWNAPSAAEGWTVGQVVTHLNLALGLYARVLDAVLSGHGSGTAWKAFSSLSKKIGPAAAPALNAVNSGIPKLMSRAIAPEALKGQFAGSARGLRQRIDRLTPGDDMRPALYMGQAWPLSFFLANMVDELAMHGWDIRSRFAPSAHLSAEARAVLPWFFWGASSFMLRVPAGTAGTIAAELSDPGAEMWWTLGGDKPLPRTGRPENAEARITTEAGTFALLLAGRLKLDAALRSTSLQIDGDDSLGRLFLSSWHIV